MKTATILPAIVLTASITVVRGDSTISDRSTQQSAYAANGGWLNANWDSAAPNGGAGVSVTEFFLSGFVWSANFGWLDFGDGTPANGFAYQNIAPAGRHDFGVNLAAGGTLSGLAYGANIGWVNFSWAAPAVMAANTPKVDLKTGRFSGLAYGANVGWITLDHNTASTADGLLTLHVTAGPDADSDGLGDAWEKLMASQAGITFSAALLTATGDRDGDKQSDLAEFLANTNPYSAADVFASTGQQMPANQWQAAWSAKAGRCYDIQSTTTLGAWTTHLTNIAPAAPGPVTQLLANNPAATPRRFFRIVVRRPLP